MFLERCIDAKWYDNSDILQRDNRYYSWQHHSSIHADTPQTLLNNINNTLQYWNENIKKIDVLIITLGTAIGYEHIENTSFVANCHKQPSNQFIKKISDNQLLIDTYQRVIHSLFAINTNLKIIMTVSPVRYIRDGVVENNISKSRLITLTHELVRSHKNVFYFPAYEVLIDVLRDYRFYADDLVHPNSVAINAIWEYFQLLFLDNNARLIIQKIENLNKALHHKSEQYSPENIEKIKQMLYELNANALGLNLKNQINELEFIKSK
jgi:hypothetical protein